MTLMAISRAALSLNICRSARQLPSQVCAVPKPRSFTTEEKPALDIDLDELKESEIEEKFVKGSGPGGQSVNKTNNRVELRHKKTGIVIQCHETRSLERNRVIARSRLLEKLRSLYKPEDSQAEKVKKEKQKRKQHYDRKRKLKELAAEEKGTLTDI